MFDRTYVFQEACSARTGDSPDSAGDVVCVFSPGTACSFLLPAARLLNIQSPRCPLVEQSVDASQINAIGHRVRNAAFILSSTGTGPMRSKCSRKVIRRPSSLRIDDEFANCCWCCGCGGCECECERELERVELCVNVLLQLWV